MRISFYCLGLCLILFFSCGKKEQKIGLMVLDPGHFHAALVAKNSYPNVDSNLYVFAPKGPEVEDFINKINQYNSREENPTNWNLKLYLGDDYLEKMISEKPGNVMVVAGKNSKKIDYILEAVKAKINVFADKPLVINKQGYDKLIEAFKIAKSNNVLIYDIMTERFEITTKIQKLLANTPQLIGKILDGDVENPAISKESVHHFYKQVSGNPLVRPSWFYDIKEEGDGLVDVTTHLVDLVQWELFPEITLENKDVEILASKLWTTSLTFEQFQKTTKASEFPGYLQDYILNNKLEVPCNGEIIYRLKGKVAKVSVIWNFEAPPGGSDTHYSKLRGENCDLVIKTKDNSPALFIETKTVDESELLKSFEIAISNDYPSLSLEKSGENEFQVIIPDSLKIGHEAHFGQVTKNYLNYLEQKKLPAWEVPNMQTKYYTTTQANEKYENL